MLFRSKLIRTIKALTKELNIIFFLVVQPKILMDGQRLNFNSIRGGAAIAQALDTLLILERMPNLQQKNMARLRLEIARSKLANPGDVFLQYIPEFTGFIEMEKMEPQPEAPLTFPKASY